MVGVAPLFKYNYYSYFSNSVREERCTVSMQIHNAAQVVEWPGLL